MMNTTKLNLPEALLEDHEQLKNYFSVEISELFRECPIETEIAEVERVLSEFLVLMGNMTKCKSQTLP
jgi:hypothetical protein